MVFRKLLQILNWENFRDLKAKQTQFNLNSIKGKMQYCAKTSKSVKKKVKNRTKKGNTFSD